MNTGALLPERGAGTSLTTVAARAGDRSSCSWRAGCGEIRKSGSEGSGEETTGRKAGIGASPLTLRATPPASITAGRNLTLVGWLDGARLQCG